MNTAIENLLLREYMKDTDLARMADVAPPTIARWRKDPDKIPLGKLEKLANGQGYSLRIVRLEREYD